jgi:hypothetical protein
MLGSAPVLAIDPIAAEEARAQVALALRKQM